MLETVANEACERVASDELEESAAAYRPKICSWIKIGCSTSMRWRLCLKDCFVQQTLSTTKTWREIMKLTAKQLKGHYKNKEKIDDIDNAIKNHLDKNKSPAQAEVWMTRASPFVSTEAGMQGSVTLAV